MVDLDSDPTKLIEIVEIGKQLLMTRGALTTFSIANDIAKYFAIIPAMFLTFYPQLGVLNIMTKIESGAMEPNGALHYAGDIVGSALRRAAKMLERHRTETSIPADLPMVRVDPVLFEQVIFNLLDNAAKYAPAETTVSIRAARDRDTILLQIVDEGSGIPPAELDSVFDKFYRVEKGDHVRPGTGLGLAISRGFVEAMHVLGYFRALDVVEVVGLIAQLIGVAQRGAEQALAEWLDGDDVLAIGQHDLGQRDAVLILHGYGQRR